MNGKGASWKFAVAVVAFLCTDFNLGLCFLSVPIINTGVALLKLTPAPFQTSNRQTRRVGVSVLGDGLVHLKRGCFSRLSVHCWTAHFLLCGGSSFKILLILWDAWLCC